MTENAPHHYRHIFRVDGHYDDAIPRMTEMTVRKAEITSEEGWAMQPTQQRDDLLVAHPLASDVIANLPGSDAPAPQHYTLPSQDIFVDNVHTGTVSIAYSSA